MPFLLTGSLLFAGTATAGTSTIGRTWPIIEPDALAEVEGKAAAIPADPGRYGPRAGWSAMKAAPLALAAQNRTRFVVPFYTLDDDIRLPDGRLLYAKGYTFNPLSYVSLPQRLIVVQPRDLDWALDQAAASDFILLAAGTPQDADAITLGEKKGRALFILEDRIKARLGLTVAPVIVRQVGQRLELQEVHLERERGRS
ncbi:MAG: conjugal transfer protein TraW [Sphingomonadales bacterium]|nr:conjugal transfer protein TraW [Sphingomonadales bacterium]MDE2169384.1 conjugal transfer protein TraW [Sphingomonadales bacterium]